MPISRTITANYDMRSFAGLHVYSMLDIEGNNVTDDIQYHDITLSSTTSIGGFDFIISNDDGKYTRQFHIGQNVNMYIDYDNTLDAGEAIISGQIDIVEYIMGQDGAFYIRISGRDYMGTEADRLVFEDFSEIPTGASTVIKYLRDKYASTHSSDDTYIEDDDTPIDLTWNGPSLLSAIQDIIEACGNKHFFRNDINKKWHFQTKGIECSHMAIVYKGNMRYLNNTDQSVFDLKNRTWLTSTHPDGTALLYRADDEVSQSTYNIHETLVENSNLVTYNQLKNKAINMNAASCSIEQKGTTGSWGLPALKPGQNVLIIHPFCNVEGEKVAVEVKHRFDMNGFMTDVTYEESEKTIIDRIIAAEKDKQKTFTIRNLYGMTRTHFMNFKDVNYGADYSTPDSSAALESMVDSIVWDNALQLQVLQTTSTSISKVLVETDNISEVLLDVKGSNFESDEGEQWLKVEMSCDGSNYFEVGVGKWSNVPVDLQGPRLILKFTITSQTTKVIAVSVLYKRIVD